MLLPKTERHRSPRHLAWIRSLRCSVPGCNNGDIQAHHVRKGAGVGLGSKKEPEGSSMVNRMLDPFRRIAGRAENLKVAQTVRSAQRQWHDMIDMKLAFGRTMANGTAPFLSGADFVDVNLGDAVARSFPPFLPCCGDAFRIAAFISILPPLSGQALGFFDLHTLRGASTAATTPTAYTATKLTLSREKDHPAGFAATPALLPLPLPMNAVTRQTASHEVRNLTCGQPHRLTALCAGGMNLRGVSFESCLVPSRNWVCHPPRPPINSAFVAASADFSYLRGRNPHRSAACCARPFDRSWSLFKQALAPIHIHLYTGIFRVCHHEKEHHAEGHFIGWRTFEVRYRVDLSEIAAKLWALNSVPETTPSHKGSLSMSDTIPVQHESAVAVLQARERVLDAERLMHLGRAEKVAERQDELLNVIAELTRKPRAARKPRVTTEAPANDTAEEPRPSVFAVPGEEAA